MALHLGARHMLRRFVLILVAVALVAGCGSASEQAGPESRAVPTTGEVNTPPNLDQLREFRSTRQQRTAGPPQSISIPRVGVAGPLASTGFNPDRTLEVPDFGDMSWFEHGPVPGDRGPAAILGHVDSKSGPDVFYRLHELSPRDEIHVTTEAGETLTFVVTRVEQHAKDQFPTEAVYMPTTGPELRLITCGGDFDHRERSYRDNIIAFAVLSS